MVTTAHLTLELALFRHMEYQNMFYIHLHQKTDFVTTF